MQTALGLSRQVQGTEFCFEAPERLPALILAYIGDAVFSLHARTIMLSVESNRVQILHTLLARMASAPLQAKALRDLEEILTEQEQSIVRRGRNAKSRVPRNASVAEYRASTALEALLGFLYLSRQEERLQQVLTRVVECAGRELAGSVKGGTSDEC